jgi:ribosomal protein S27AE
MGMSSALECPFCSAATNLRIVASLSNLVRLAANALLLGIDAVLAVTLGSAALTEEGWPFALKRRCSRCGGKFLTKTRVLKAPECGNCGYNLTGNVSGVCPECGWRLTRRMRQLVRRRSSRAEQQDPPDTPHASIH